MANEIGLRGLSPDVLEYLKATESFSSTPYPDGHGSYSKGFGVLERSHPAIWKKYPGDVTRDQADKMTNDVLVDHENQLQYYFGKETWFKMDKNMAEYIQVVAYNAGPKRVWFQVGPHIRAGNEDKVYETLRHMAKEGMAGKQRVNLSKRREADWEFFEKRRAQAKAGTAKESIVTAAVITGLLRLLR